MPWLQPGVRRRLDPLQTQASRADGRNNISFVDPALEAEEVRERFREVFLEVESRVWW